MKKLRPMGIIAVVCLTGLAIVLGARGGRSDAARLNGDTARSGGTAKAVASATPNQVSTQTSVVPDNVVYGIMFRQIAAFNAKADEVERSGGDGRSLRRHFARIATLNDAESELLDRIAADYMREAGIIDARQRAMVDAFHVQYPGGQMPHGEPRERPAAYHELNLDRDQLYLRMRDQLQTVLGTETFARFDTAVRSKIAGNPDSILRSAAPSSQQMTDQEKP